MSLLRFAGVVLCILGFFLLFSPIIEMLAMVPLVGMFLSQFANIAALLFALVVGCTLSFATIAVAWVFHRPFMGISMLTIVFISIYFTFYYDQDVS